MTLKAICPECGMAGDMAAFVALGEHNQALAAALEIPGQLGPRVIRYLGLFRPRSRALAGAKALRLLVELRDAIALEQIERHGVTRAAPVGVWAAALDQLLERPPSKLPLTGHGYLFEVVAGVADKREAQQERAKEDAKRSGSANVPANPAHVTYRRERSTDDVLAEHKRLLARQGKRENVTLPSGPQSLGQLLKGAPGAKERDS